MSEIDVSDFCLVCYYDKETNKLARIENYTNNSSDIEADIKSYEYGYNEVVIKPEQLMEELQQLKAENKKLSTQNYYLDKANLELAEENDKLYQCLDEIFENIEYVEATAKRIDDDNYIALACRIAETSRNILHLIKQAKDN